jgi:hypothetical protein
LIEEEPNILELVGGFLTPLLGNISDQCRTDSQAYISQLNKVTDSQAYISQLNKVTDSQAYSMSVSSTR